MKGSLLAIALLGLGCGLPGESRSYRGPRKGCGKAKRAERKKERQNKKRGRK